MANTLTLEIATADNSAELHDVEMVTLPGADGELGVYPDHTALMTPIKPGELAVRQNGSDRYIAVGEGMAEITSRRVVVLTDMAIPAEELDGRKAQDDLEREQEKLKMKLSEKEYAAVSGRVSRLVAQVTTMQDYRK